MDSCGRFVLQAGLQLRNAWGRLQGDQSADFPKANAPCSLDVTRNRSTGDVSGAAPASSDHDKFLVSVRRQGAQRVFTTLFEDQCDGIAKISQALLSRFTLSVRTGNLGTIGNIPSSVTFNDGGELVPHRNSLLAQQPVTELVVLEEYELTRGFPELSPWWTTA